MMPVGLCSPVFHKTLEVVRVFELAGVSKSNCVKAKLMFS